MKRNRSTRLIILAMLLLAACNGGRSSTPATTTSGIVHFVPNSHAFWSNPTNWTTTFGPAYADITLASSNFVPCRGGPFALCYYSGPSSGAEDLSCTLTADGKYANCQCFDIPYGVYFVDINAILNHAVYEKTIAQCGADGSLCATLNSAPVCANVNAGNLMPGSSVYSTFSFDCVPENGLGLTNCAQQPYAGCMTAPCFKTAQAGIVQCSCPVFDGPYQVGQNDQACTLGDGLTWSAAYAPPATPAPTPAVSADAYKMMSSADEREAAVPAAVPSPPACLPDAPGGIGCPLYVPGVTMLPPDSGVDCAKVCDEYHTCLQPKGAQAGFTCDATLCTDECNDRDLVSTACSGLAGCDISEIVKVETAADCSCCASQLCQCDPSAKTNKAISALNQQQRDRSIKPQCDINGTLCGTP
ncbi:hypothetical protein [Candidatus Binatus sp.]|uniref:hypothetical protein n=1 Tax=Candidatus Binatus sp. TaxID=2811406 RepID=UPI003C95705E